MGRGEQLSCDLRNVAAVVNGVYAVCDIQNHFIILLQSFYRVSGQYSHKNTYISPCNLFTDYCYTVFSLAPCRCLYTSGSSISFSVIFWCAVVVKTGCATEM